ncbi:MAG: TVP38/TMEM64 family protein [Oligoflexales bacterium]|nr:TVP38/TMEM64 family protein [Oligoflexales bacterium]
MFTKYKSPLILLALTVIAIVFISFYDKLGTAVQYLVEIYHERQKLIDFVLAQGKLGPLIFILIQALQVIFAPIPGEFTGAVAGIIFGPFWGTLYSSLGLLIGSGAAFLIGRYFGNKLKFLKPDAENSSRLLKMIRHEKAPFVFWICFLLPGFPKDILSYIVGLSSIGFWRFLCISNIARLPGTIMLTLSGDFFNNSQWWALGGLAAILIVLLLISHFYKKSQKL